MRLQFRTCCFTLSFWYLKPVVVQIGLIMLSCTWRLGSQSRARKERVSRSSPIKPESRKRDISRNRERSSKSSHASSYDFCHFLDQNNIKKYQLCFTTSTDCASNSDAFTLLEHFNQTKKESTIYSLFLGEIWNAFFFFLCVHFFFFLSCQYSKKAYLSSLSILNARFLFGFKLERN